MLHLLLALLPQSLDVETYHELVTVGLGHGSDLLTYTWFGMSARGLIPQGLCRSLQEDGGCFHWGRGGGPGSHMGGSEGQTDWGALSYELQLEAHLHKGEAVRG